MTHPLDGTFEKLERADQNIRNLESEIALFFKESEYPIIPQGDMETFKKAIDYHSSRAMSPRFSVLAGEVIHHLRSALDHVAWQLSSTTYRRDFARAIEFPIFDEEPVKKKERSRYERKIEGISSTQARLLIEQFQPYQRGDDVINDPLLIVHNMDRIDKHQELVILLPGLHSRLDLREFVSQIDRMKREAEMANKPIPTIPEAMQKYAIVTPQVSFREFGDLDYKPVIPGLFQLAKYIKNVVSMFAGEIK
ncbi:MAG: hypothetical protein LAO20_10575 [Acidobacteriia bacterium]|nr:hypothetical protein [Terriglobia bacterium]